tara:strand:+ start:315 stop:851 length:537 start_codon:yes stop_codon:yes gene_type:complete
MLLIPALSSCGAFKYKPVGKDVSPNPEERVKKNIEEGRGFRLMGAMNRGGKFDFASSNPLWRASLDTIDFMPLASANYSGGVVITDWYSEDSNLNESIKITIRFNSNEIRADALDIKVFLKKCDQSMNCIVSENEGELSQELRASILRRATIYKKEGIEKGKKENPYILSTPGDSSKN